MLGWDSTFCIQNFQTQSRAFCATSLRDISQLPPSISGLTGVVRTQSTRIQVLSGASVHLRSIFPRPSRVAAAPFATPSKWSPRRGAKIQGYARLIDDMSPLGLASHVVTSPIHHGPRTASNRVFRGGERVCDGP
jgi:hypothetical protein